jgi:hypothetical protein
MQQFELIPLGLRHHDVAARYLMGAADADHDRRLYARATLAGVPLHDVALLALVADAPAEQIF